jgi:ribosome-associated protein
MSKSARPARTAAPRTTSAARTKKAPVRKPVKAKAPKARRPAAAPRPKSGAARTTASPAPEKRAARPRLPADVKAAVAAAQEKLAVDLTVLDLRNATAFTDFFIVCTGTNTKQVQAIADGIEASLRAAGQKPALVEGYRRGEWILMDYFNFIVHIFLPARRTFYALERLWGGAEPIEVSAP